MPIQRTLGADIQMVLDVCPPLPVADAVVRGRGRPHRAPGPARAAPRSSTGAGWRTDRGLDQAQFGIVQGGVDLGAAARRAPSAPSSSASTATRIGGLSVGETRDEMLPALAAAIEHLPADQPRYLMGVGDPAGIVEAVGLGVDLFDCVLPTRLARHGTILTDDGPAQPQERRVRARRAARSTRPAACPVCARWSRAYLRHLLRVGEPTAARLLTHPQRGLAVEPGGRACAPPSGRGPFDAARRRCSTSGADGQSGHRRAGRVPEALSRT